MAKNEKTISITLSDELHKKFKIKCIEEGENQRSKVRKMIYDFVTNDDSEFTQDVI